jgi:hypothetical protein
MFVRQNQLIPLNEDGSPSELSPSSAAGRVSSGGTTPRSGTTTPKSGSITPRQASSSSIKRETSSSSIKGSTSNTPRRGGRGIPQPSGGPSTTSGLPRSRLPMPGTGPTQGRQPSFTNLKTIKDRNSTGGTGSVTSGGGSSQPKQSGMQRERSFVEPNFVETFKPPQVQIMSASTSSPNPNLMGSPGHASQKMSERLEEKVAILQVY